MKKIFTTLGTSTLLTLSPALIHFSHAGQNALSKKQVRKHFAEIEEKHSFSNLKVYLAERYTDIHSAIVQRIDELQGSENEEEQELLKALKGVEKNLSNNVDKADPIKSQAYINAIRAIYSIKGEKSMEELFETGRSNTIPGALRVVASPSAYQIWVPSLTVGEMNTPVKFLDKSGDRFKKASRNDLHRARKEASNLINPMNPNQLATPDELVEMTPLQISELSFNDAHPAWLNAAGKARTPNRFQAIENWVNDTVTANLADGENTADSYDVREAHKVLFFDKYKESATAAKISVKDAYGAKWKIKWGTEVHTEAVSSRLFAAAGAKMVDLVYVTDPGMVLVLDENQTAESFRNDMLEGRYKFLVDPHVVETGVITTDNADRVLQNLHSNSLTQKKAKIRNLIGRSYVVFLESSVEFKYNSKANANRIGPVAESQLGAENDRVARGRVIVNNWLHNADLKDDNSKTMILKTPLDGQTYFEYQHDLGVTLGHIIHKGDLNTFEVGREFIRPHMKGRPFIVLDQYNFYRPTAWFKASFADARWGAMQVAAVTDAQIEEAVASSKLPDFWQQAAQQKLKQRRNAIAELFHVDGLPSAGSVENEMIVQPLETLKDRQQAAQQYDIPVDIINSELIRLGKLDSADGISSHTEDVLLSADGQIALCHEALLPSLIERHRHPSGVQRRLSTSSDDAPLKPCSLDNPASRSFVDRAANLFYKFSR